MRPLQMRAASATATALGSRLARSHVPSLEFIPSRTHHPQSQANHRPSRRVFQTISPGRAFYDRLRRHSLQSPSHPRLASRQLTSALLQSSETTTTTTTIMASPTQERGHSHGHGHHHHHDNTYLVSKNKNDPGVRITRIGLYSNLGMAIVKGAGGYAFGSQALVADAWHSLTDLASDVLTLATVSWSLRPPTDKFPVGFGKVESLGSLGVSGMLLFGGLYMCMSSCTTLYAQLFLDGAEAAALLEHAHSHGHSHGGHGHGHGHGHGVPSLHAAWLSAGTVIVKEWLYQASKRPPLPVTYNPTLTPSPLQP